ncbi:L-glutamine ABC transporter membrane protein /L-glutamate ABC transporter membrane protein /L-aspartate ABC transporter membrane protein /L-asparagine ABC transporter membrane protein [Gemmobacter megaterium]|uniref:L-glutamine ABC transporter membrane protein /L-glutamate ABC transporter membrane protein /L-aspartate ABC transporter membrane protein /L-asparagine ABC transporter membrane protein n=1 Tax=Gemmobacter megaterium TaxID=1086013 RepID=A0A1N7LV20_9RHOB|nr:amino acid ABC transporter permease [Gemmobacter megaterium]GGE10448.1 amino acid ABC transporter permease [Gemmobacter megaterium]SIS77715.1 L-glutamine ABC transporter membrane protein /L-glutamate ABC transporter membrane protein /L-aspartate ABC transporter membrane protein /L-asparagine ABC transporter membrane protein [Gemmobacter megaterium]
MSDTHAQTVPFVRDTMLPQQAPPTSQIGAVRWLRENLFSSVLNVALTVLAVGTIVWIVMHIGPWLMNSVWNANSLAECRQILAGESGACFAVIRDRWHQLMFGFYPSDLYWRPILAMVLMLVAIAPILFDKLPRKLIWFSALYPFVAFWLLWGGSLWLPLAVIGGFAVGYGAFLGLSRVTGSVLALIGAVLAAIVWWVWLAAPVSSALQSAVSLSIRPVPSRDFGGFMLSIIIGVTGIALSLPLGIMLALGRKSDMLLIKAISVGFIEFIRGVPLITLLFTASLLLNYFLPPGTSFDIILRVIIMVTLFAAAYMAEVIRGGLAALPRGQYEAADALGLDYWKAMRLIILPQALKISIPGIVNTFIGLFKDTTLVVFIGLLDPIGLSNAIRADTNWNGIYWELFIFIGVCFFIFCFGMSRYSMYLERRLKTDHR